MGLKWEFDKQSMGDIKLDIYCVHFHDTGYSISNIKCHAKVSSDFVFILMQKKKV